MKEELVLTFVAGYPEPKPGRKRFLLWASLAVHAVAVVGLLLVPLLEVEEDIPQFESVATFLVRATPAPPPPPPPPPPPRTVAGPRSPKPTPRAMTEGQFVAPVAIPASISMEDFGSDFFAPGGVEGGVPGGVTGGIVGGLADAPAPEAQDEPVRLDFRAEGATPVVRIEPDYPDLAVEARVQGVVILEVLVGADGVPRDVEVLRSIPLLEAAAVEAVRGWRWNPYVMLGRPVPFRVTVTVSFRLT